jgi:hypothetical protein
MARYEGRYISCIGWLSNQVGDVEGEEVAGIQKAADRLQVDVIGVEKVGQRPRRSGSGLAPIR